MSIIPAIQFGTSSVEGDTRDAQVSISENRSAASSSNSGSEPKQALHEKETTSQSSELSQDEVQVQQDGGDGKIVIRYLDGSGNLILQVPSPQVLGLARAIDQALRDQVRSGTVTCSSRQSKEGGSDGN